MRIDRISGYPNRDIEVTSVKPRQWPQLSVGRLLRSQRMGPARVPPAPHRAAGTASATPRRRSASGEKTQAQLAEMYSKVSNSVELAVRAVRENDQHAAESVLLRNGLPHPPRITSSWCSSKRRSSNRCGAFTRCRNESPRWWCPRCWRNRIDATVFSVDGFQVYPGLLHTSRNHGAAGQRKACRGKD